MKIALLADLHSNLEAVETCIAHARAHGADRFAFLGDYVGYNADPVAVLDKVRRMAEEEGALLVKGNHDAASAGEDTGRMNDAAVEAIRWTQRQLSAQHADFLRRLPMTLVDDGMTLVHASAASPAQWIYVGDGRCAAASMDAAATPYVFSGHVHDPMLYYMGSDHRPQPFLPVAGIPIPVARHRRWLGIVGSCGQPRDGDPRARYALFDRDHAMLTFHRVDYDRAAAARKVRLAGLPEEFAVRLETGK